MFPKPEPEPGTKKLKPIQGNSNTLEALYANRYYQGGKPKDWADNKGACKAVYKFNTVLTVSQYHMDP